MNLAVVILVDWLLPTSPLAGEDPHVSLPEGGVTERVAERVDGGVEVAQAVGDVPHKLRDELLQITHYSKIMIRQNNIENIKG